jgi:hypothetical protein
MISFSSAIPGRAAAQSRPAIATGLIVGPLLSPPRAALLVSHEPAATRRQQGIHQAG